MKKLHKFGLCLLGILFVILCILFQDWSGKDNVTEEIITFEKEKTGFSNLYIVNVKLEEVDNTVPFSYIYGKAGITRDTISKEDFIKIYQKNSDRVIICQDVLFNNLNNTLKKAAIPMMQEAEKYGHPYTIEDSGPIVEDNSYYVEHRAKQYVCEGSLKSINRGLNETYSCDGFPVKLNPHDCKEPFEWSGIVTAQATIPYKCCMDKYCSEFPLKIVKANYEVKAGCYVGD